MLGDIQVKMRLKVTGSREELRQDYMPLLSVKTVMPFTIKGADAAVSLATSFGLDDALLTKIIFPRPLSTMSFLISTSIT